MKTILIRIFSIILILGTFSAIFIFSSQDGIKSKSTSKEFTRKIIQILPNTRNLSEKQKEKLIEKSQYVVRKTAHFTIYAIAGLSTILFIDTYKIKTGKKVLITLVICIIYATSDEINQLFSGFRTSSPIDVCIDTFGATVGVGFFLIIKDTISRYFRKINKV